LMELTVDEKVALYKRFISLWRQGQEIPISGRYQDGTLYLTFEVSKVSGDGQGPGQRRDKTTGTDHAPARMAVEEKITQSSIARDKEAGLIKANPLLAPLFVDSAIKVNPSGSGKIIERANFNIILDPSDPGTYYRVSKRTNANDPAANTNGLLATETENTVMLSKAGAKEIIPEALAMGVNEDGLAWAKMRGIVGEDLFSELFKSFDFAKRLRITAKVAAALAVLHELGYVHGDVQEGNVITNEREEVMFIDLLLVQKSSGRDDLVHRDIERFLGMVKATPEPSLISWDDLIQSGLRAIVTGNGQSMAEIHKKLLKAQEYFEKKSRVKGGVDLTAKNFKIKTDGNGDDIVGARSPRPLSGRGNPAPTNNVENYDYLTFDVTDLKDITVGEAEKFVGGTP